MSFLDTPRDRAGFLILLLALAVLIAISPFLSGLIGAAVLYVIFLKPYQRLERVVKPGFAASIILIAALLVIAIPLIWLTAAVIAQTPDALQSLQSSGVLARTGQLRLGNVDIDLGAELAKASSTMVSWFSSRIFSLVGTATSAVLNLVIACFGLYYLLRSEGHAWTVVRSYIPFSAKTADALRDRFFVVTEATLLGTVLVAVIQGALVGFGFWVVDLSHPVFWGSATAVASILPVLGSALVWGPAVLVLLAQNRYGQAVTMLVIGGGIASNIDNLIRPVVYRRVSNVHPMITLIGAFAGVRFFGLLGLLIGPLGIAYLFELLRFYREEYGAPGDRVGRH